MIIRRSDERGLADHGWLRSRHTFSFADYHDPAHMGFRTLRVINQDVVQPGRGFGTHAHRDMEIISYVLEGELAHRDSMGNEGVIRAGDVQRMTAGTGVAHSEFNHSPREPVHFLQIWITPERRGLEPGYEQRSFSPGERRGALRLVASRDGREGSVTVHQDVELRAALLEADQEVRHELAPGRGAWIQLVRGSVQLDGERLGPGDGAAVEQPGVLRFTAAEPAELLLFDLG